MGTLTIPTFNLPGTVTQTDIINALALEWGYPLQVPDPQNAGQLINNPMPKATFVKQYLAQLFKTIYLRQQKAAAAQTASDAVTDPGAIT